MFVSTLGSIKSDCVKHISPDSNRQNLREMALRRLSNIWSGSVFGSQRNQISQLLKVTVLWPLANNSSCLQLGHARPQFFRRYLNVHIIVRCSSVALHVHQTAAKHLSGSCSPSSTQELDFSHSCDHFGNRYKVSSPLIFPVLPRPLRTRTSSHGLFFFSGSASAVDHF